MYIKIYFKFIYISYVILNEIIKYNIINFYYICTNKNKLNRIDCIKNITKKIENINITYLKFIQSICFDKDLLNNDENNYLIKFLDNVPYKNEDIDYDTLYKLNKEFDIEIDFNRVINSGMVGIVFDAVDKNNNKLVVKVLKKNIQHKLEESLFELEIFIRKLKLLRIPYVSFLEKILDDNKICFLSQLDFSNEVYNILKFKDLYKNIKEYRIPFVIKEITEKYNNIIVMENIKGYTYKDLSNFNKEDIKEFCKLYQKIGYISILYTGAIHNDLHSGNFFFYKNTDDKSNLPKYQLGIIDFGICTYISRENQNVYYKFFYELYIEKKFNDENLLQFINMISYSNMINLSSQDIYNINLNIIDDFKNFLYNYTDSIIDEHLIKILFSILKKYNLSCRQEFSKIMFGLKITNNIAKNMSDDLDSISIEVFKDMVKINNLISIND